MLFRSEQLSPTESNRIFRTVNPLAQPKYPDSQIRWHSITDASPPAAFRSLQRTHRVRLGRAPCGRGASALSVHHRICESEYQDGSNPSSPTSNKEAGQDIFPGLYRFVQELLENIPLIHRFIEPISTFRKYPCSRITQRLLEIDEKPERFF